MLFRNEIKLFHYLCNLNGIDYVEKELINLKQLKGILISFQE